MAKQKQKQILSHFLLCDVELHKNTYFSESETQIL